MYVEMYREAVLMTTEGNNVKARLAHYPIFLNIALELNDSE